MLAIFLALVGILIHLPLDAEEFIRKLPKKQRQEEYILQLGSEIPNLQVFQDGVLGGSEMNAVKGWNVVTVTAPGYSMRTVRFFLDRPGIHSKKVVLLKTPPANKNRLRPELPVNLPVQKNVISKSSCELVKSQKEPICTRKELVEDFLFSGLVWEDYRSFDNVPDNQKAQLTDRAVLRWEDDPKPLRLLEELYAAQPQNIALIDALAKDLLFYNECHRLGDLISASYQLNQPLGNLLTYTALCYERLGLPELSRALLEKHAKGSASSEFAPYLYHYARLLMPDYKNEARQVLDHCIKIFRGYYPCYELKKILNILENSPFQRIDTEYSKEVSAIVKPLYIAWRTNSNRSELNKIMTVMANIRLSYELLWAEFFTLAESSQRMSVATLQTRLKYAVIADQKVALDILDELTKRKDNALLAMGLLSFVNAYSQVQNYWMRLIKAYEATGQWEKALEQAQRATRYFSEEQIRPINLHRGQCLVALKRYQEAAKVYKRISEVFPDYWGSYFNLAVVYERLNDDKNALDNYRAAFKRRPPEDKLKLIVAKTEELGGTLAEE